MPPDDTPPAYPAEVGTQTIVQHPDGRLLLAKREDFRVWVFPGGMLETDETLEAGARREVYEETGITIGSPVLQGIYSTGRAYKIVYTARPNGGQLRISFESVAVDYYPPDELPARMPTPLQVVIDDFIQQRRGVLRLERWPWHMRLLLPALVGLRDLRNRYILKRPTPSRTHFTVQAHAVLDGQPVATVRARRGIPVWETLAARLQKERPAVRLGALTRVTNDPATGQLDLTITCHLPKK